MSDPIRLVGGYMFNLVTRKRTIDSTNWVMLVITWFARRREPEGIVNLSESGQMEGNNGIRCGHAESTWVRVPADISLFQHSTMTLRGRALAMVQAK